LPAAGIERESKERRAKKGSPFTASNQRGAKRIINAVASKESEQRRVAATRPAQSGDCHAATRRFGLRSATIVTPIYLACLRAQLLHFRKMTENRPDFFVSLQVIVSQEVAAGDF
jgi:hypothetical protein